MRRALIAVVAIVVVLIGTATAARGFAVAEDATPTHSSGTTAEHPVVGTWRWENDRLRPGDTSFAVIDSGGTYVEYYPGHGVGIGAWEATGERTASLSIVFQDLDPASDVVVPGLLTYRLAVVAEDGGDALSATGTYYLQTPDGSVVEERSFDGAATRVEVTATGPLPVPVPATPTS